MYLHRSHLLHAVRAEYLLIHYLEVDFRYKIIPTIILFSYTPLFHFIEKKDIMNPGCPANQIILPLIVILSLRVGEYNERGFLKYIGFSKLDCMDPFFVLFVLGLASGKTGFEE